MQEGNIFFTLLVYVDDIFLVSCDILVVKSIKTAFNDQFKLKDLGFVKYFLGIEIARIKVDIFICQKKYALELLEDTGLLVSKPVIFSMDTHYKFNKKQGNLLEDSTSYIRLISDYCISQTPDHTLHFLSNNLTNFLINLDDHTCL